MSKLTHVMIDGGDILDEEELFELLEIGIYVLTVLTRKERDISKSSVKKGFQIDNNLINQISVWKPELGKHISIGSNSTQGTFDFIDFSAAHSNNRIGCSYGLCRTRDYY